MLLDQFTSDCGLRDSIVISRDKGSPRKHIARTNGCCVTQYRIDGYVITQGNKCDYLVINETNLIAYFIELKGADLSWAARQLTATIDKFGNTFSNKYQIRLRIVASKCRTHEIETTEFHKFKVKWKKALKYATNVIDESI